MRSLRLESAFKNYIKTNDIINVEKMLLNKVLEPDYNNDEAFGYACLGGHYDIVKLFLNDNRIDPDCWDYNPLIELSTKIPHISTGKLHNNKNKMLSKIMILLINNKKVSPDRGLSQAFLSIIDSNNIEVFNAFIKEGTADFSARNSLPISHAYKLGHTDIKNTLKNIPKVMKQLKKDDLNLYNFIITEDIKKKVEGFHE